MRPEIDTTEDKRDRVREYAQEHGLTMARAWAEIIDAGIDAIDNDDEDDTNESELQH